MLKIERLRAFSEDAFFCDDVMDVPKKTELRLYLINLLLNLSQRFRIFSITTQYISSPRRYILHEDQ